MIHNTSIIHKTAEIEKDVTIGPWCNIGRNVKIASGNVIYNNVTIHENSSIDKDNQIFPYAVLGTDPQDLKYNQEETSLEIGCNNKIREFVTINRGTNVDNKVTRIGNNNLLMAYSHVAHDCVIGSNVILANNATLAGHVTVKDNVIIGAFCAVHQFCIIGDYSMLSHGVLVNKNVLPYTMVSPSERDIKTSGLNTRGLKRKNFTEAQIRDLKQAYKIIYRNNSPMKTRLDALEQLAVNDPNIQLFYEVLKQSVERGFV